MHEAGKALVVIFPTGQYPSELVQPCKQAFDRPSPLVSTQYTAILCGWPDAPPPMRRDHLDAIGGELCIERITVIGTIPDKSLGQSHGDNRIDGSFDKGDFMWASRSRVHGEWKTCSVRNGHELRTLAALGLSHFTPPFFATTKVPSMKHSDRSISPLACKSSAKASSTCRSVPSLTHWLKRRKHVEYDGYRSGRSAQAAPVRNIHSTPSSTARSLCSTGLPRPSARCLGGGIKGDSTAHCSSVRNFLLAISDSALPEICADRYL
jgi:hypothetical protein